MSAGARLTVTRVLGKLKPEFLIADRIRSRDSEIAVSGNPTIVNFGKPGDMSASTCNRIAFSPMCADE
jgi:hypothetical protein